MIEPILSIYKADISDHKAKIKELSGEQKKLAQEQLGHLESQNKKLDGYIQTIGKAGVAIGAAAVAGKLLWEGWEHNARKAQLATNVLWSDVDRLRTGFGGLRTEMEALEIANKLSHSSFKLSGEQMQTVGRSIRQLVREGHTWDEATQKVTESIVKLEGDALKDFGIRLRESKTDGERFAAIMDGLTEKSAKLGTTAKTNAEDLVGMKTRFADAMDGIKAGLGDIATAFAPLIDQLAQVVGFVGQIANAGGGILGKAVGFAAKWNPIGLGGRAVMAGVDYLGRDTGTLGPRLQQRVQIPDALRWNPGANRSAAAPVADFNLADILAGGTVDLNMLAYLAQGRAGDWLGEIAKKSKPGKGGKPKMPGYTLGGNQYGTGTSSALGGPSGPTDISSSLTNNSFLTADWNSRLAGYEANHQQTQSLLAKTFGPIDEFNAYGQAFEGLTTVVQGAFDAWITGSMSVGQAIKKMAGEVLRANAVELMGQAIKHGVYAIGSLAFGDFRGAAQHGAAAAKATAGAVALGVLAKGLGAGGGGGGGGGAGAGAAPTGSSSGGGQGGGGNTYVVTYGDSLADDSPTMKSRNARKMIDSVMGSPGVR